jgi:predicted ribosomally synthesized peptide with SipW-like signal peptide
MKRKYIIGVSLMALAVAVLGSGVLYAYFNDTQTAGSNTFTSGSLLLQVGSAAPCVETIGVSGLKPGDASNVASWQLQNTGTINGKLDISISAITNDENTINRAESAAGDVTPGGEMGANLNVAFWVDVDNSGTWTSGDYYLKSDGNKVSFQAGDSSLPAAAFDALDNYGTRSYTELQTDIAPGTFGYFMVDYELPSATGNTVQTDSCTFDIAFTFNQN